MLDLDLSYLIHQAAEGTSVVLVSAAVIFIGSTKSNWVVTKQMQLLIKRWKLFIIKYYLNFFRWIKFHRVPMFRFFLLFPVSWVFPWPPWDHSTHPCKSFFSVSNVSIARTNCPKARSNWNRNKKNRREKRREEEKKES